MKIALFDEWRVGIVDGDDLVDVTSLVPGWAPKWPYPWMLNLIDQFARIRPQWETHLTGAERRPLRQVRLKPPIPMPSKIVAAPVNYVLHQTEMGGAGGVYAGAQIKTIEDYGLFLKPSSSIVGPEATITLPFQQRRTDHEAEIGVIIGRVVRNLTEDQAESAIFGVTGLLDLSVRGQEDRPFRKGFDGFCPIGPVMVTRDELAPLDAMTFRFWVNQELRQEGNTRDMIYSIRRLVSLASYQCTLFPGDIIASGTPAGVGPVRPGDTMHLQVDGVGDLRVYAAPDYAKTPEGMGPWFSPFEISRGAPH